MVLSKQRIAALVKRLPVALRLVHFLWRLTRPRFSAGVVGVVFNPLGEVLIVEHVYHTYPQWGLPGGYVDRGENPDTTIARELREELELRVEVGRIVLLERAYAGHLDIAYLCSAGSEVGALSDELLDYRWVLPDQLPAVQPFHRRAVQAALALTDVPLCLQV